MSSAGWRGFAGRAQWLTDLQQESVELHFVLSQALAEGGRLGQGVLQRGLLTAVLGEGQLVGGTLGLRLTGRTSHQHVCFINPCIEKK